MTVITSFAYLFEIRQIQKYIFATNKLRDISGASELIDWISSEDENSENPKRPDVGGLAGQFITSLIPKASVYRAAGGALDLTHGSIDELRKFRLAFRLSMSKHAPGLVFNDNIGSGETDQRARQAARNGMSSSGPISGVSFPLGSPMIRPAPLTGGSPAMGPKLTKAGKCIITKAYSDLPTLTKRHFLGRRDLRLQRKFTPSDNSEDLHWPTVFFQEEGVSQQEIFPFGKNVLPRVAVLHADGNGMGGIFAEAVKLVPENVRELSLGFATATRIAIADAMGQVISHARDNVVPARPIVLGGDDVTILLRADLAVDFATAFAQSFEVEATRTVNSYEALKSWFATSAAKGNVTTKIGLAIIAPNQPFAKAYTLAEQLAKDARRVDESRIAFHRVSGGSIPASTSELEEMAEARGGFTLWRASHSLSEMKALRSLAVLLEDEDIGRGALRKVPEILKSDRAEAARIFKRALGVTRLRSPKVSKKLTDALAAVQMPDLGSEAAHATWCPLQQAHDLAHILRSQD